MGRELCDVWAVRVDGLWLESGPVGWDLLPVPVAVDRVTLVDRDVNPEAIRSTWAADSTDLMLSGGVTIVYESHAKRRPSGTSDSARNNRQLEKPAD
jgi:hypothetical protein